jgi:transcriptional regulator
MPAELDLIRGTLDLLILKTLSWGPRHGYNVARWIQETSGDQLRVEEGALYTALHRLESREWVAGEWGTSENNRRARFYSLTPAGRKQLAQQSATWNRYAAAVATILHVI